MTCEEMIAYCSRFKPDDPIGFLAVNVEKRVCYPIPAYQCIDEDPVVLLELGEPEPPDDLLEEVSE